VTVGGGGAMLSEDVLAGTYREQGAQFMRGVTTVELFTYWGGDERGSNFAGPVNDFPISIPIGSHAPHAAGAALAFKLRDEQRAVLCVFGDGATSKGDVYEAMNLAGVWKLPLVFLVNNNQWAISLPRAAQTASRTLAHKAFACGFGGEQVDGNDVIAVRHAVAEALANARGGGGPRLIEALTYRLTDHTTADDASRYRDDETVGEFWKQEPLARLRNYLSESSGWTRENEEALIADCAAEIEKAAEEYLALAPASPETMFDYLYASLPKDLAAQRDEVLKKAAGDG
jgi:pyruvate dehydrogenase E1 component alpha subunit